MRVEHLVGDRRRETRACVASCHTKARAEAFEFWRHLRGLQRQGQDRLDASFGGLEEDFRIRRREGHHGQNCREEFCLLKGSCSVSQFHNHHVGRVQAR